MATLIKVNGDEKENYPCDSLSDMQEAVGGYIEPIYTSERVILVDEEGLLKQLPINVRVSGMVGSYIVGDALIFTRKEWNTLNK